MFVVYKADMPSLIPAYHQTQTEIKIKYPYVYFTPNDLLKFSVKLKQNE